MTIDPNAGYVFDSTTECDRLERQAVLCEVTDHLRFMSVPKGARILDAGCGSGAITRLFAEHFPDSQVVGVDRQSGYIAYARERAERAGLRNVTFEEGDVYSLPFANASFDVVWQKMVLHLLPRPEEVLSEFKRVTRPGGIVICCNEDGNLQSNWPPNPELQRRIDLALSQIIDLNMGRKLPLMFHKLGLQDIKVDIDFNRAMCAIGSMGKEKLSNLEQMLVLAQPHFATALGNVENANALIHDILAYLADPATSSMHPLYFVRGYVP